MESSDSSLLVPRLGASQVIPPQTALVGYVSLRTQLFAYCLEPTAEELIDDPVDHVLRNLSEIEHNEKVRCHFPDEKLRPKMIRLHHVRDEVIAA